MTAIHPVFAFLVIMFGVGLWFSLRRLFRPVGGKAKDIMEDTIKSMDLTEEPEETITEDVKE